MAQEKDLVLIYLEGQPVTYARIEAISPDVKKDWYHVQLLLLQIPLQSVTWILRDAYIDGAEFTMDGKPMRLERVESPVPPAETEPSEEAAPETAANGGKVISLASRKKD